MQYTGTTHFIAALAALAALAAATTGCGKSEDGASDPKAALQAVEAAVPAINEAVPAALRDRLTFEAAKVEDDELAAAVPSGWESKHMPGSYRPADEADLGFMTRFSVGSNCDGYCKPKDWAASVQQIEFAQFETDGFEIEKDEELANGRLLVARSDDSAYVVAAWWKSDASKYYYCRASLDDDAADAVAAFETACRNTHVLAW
jgi:hypothetical protein